MKSASRTGSSMFKATVCRSSESCGDRATTSRKAPAHSARSAESSVSRAPIRFATGSTLACKNGFSVTTDRMRMRSKPSTNTTRLPLGILTVLWSLGHRADPVEIDLAGILHARIKLRYHSQEAVLTLERTEQGQGNSRALR